MRYDEAGAIITDALTGRTIQYVLRKGLELHLVCADGHVIVLAADVDYNIQHKKTGVNVVLPGVSMVSAVGEF